MKITCLLFLTMNWLTLTHGIAYAALLRAEPALECRSGTVALECRSRAAAFLECGSGGAAFGCGACSAAGKAVAALPHEAVLHPLLWSVRENSALSPLGESGLCESSALSPLGERAARDGVFTSRRGPGEGVPTWMGLPHRSSLSQRLSREEGVLRLALSPADAPRRPAQGDAGRVRRHLGAASQKVNRPKQLLNCHQGSPPDNPMNLIQPGSSRSVAATRNVFIRNETVNNALAVRTPSVLRPTVPLLNNVRHRGPNPAVMGGSLNSHGTNTGTINGTRMNHRM
jgi:hypothetical protein